MSLNTCEHDNSVVVYEGVICPVCEMDDVIRELESDVNELEEENQELREKVNE